MGAKKKILKYLEYKGISQGKFCRDINVSNGFLGSGVHIGSDKLMSIRDNYSDLNMDWLIYNEGNMILKEEGAPMMANESSTHYKNGHENCSHLEDMLKAKEEIIESKEQHIASLKHQLGINGDKDKSKAS